MKLEGYGQPAIRAKVTRNWGFLGPNVRQNRSKSLIIFLVESLRKEWNFDPLLVQKKYHLSFCTKIIFDPLASQAFVKYWIEFTISLLVFLSNHKNHKTKVNQNS